MYILTSYIRPSHGQFSLNNKKMLTTTISYLLTQYKCLKIWNLPTYSVQNAFLSSWILLVFKFSVLTLVLVFLNFPPSPYTLLILFY